MKTILCCVFLTVLVIARPAWANPPTEMTTAVDANGVRHIANAYKGPLPAWFIDRVHIVAPNYPRFDRARYNEGSGLFHIVLDLKTGFVTQVTVLRTTGFDSLDACAVAALQQWRWKPGKWKEIDLPLTFKVGS